MNSVPLLNVDVWDELDPAWAPYTGVVTPLDGGTLCLPPGCPTPRVTWHDTGGHPQAYRFGALPSGGYEYVPTSLLTGEPTLQTTPKQVVTYKLNPQAVWSDGVQITSADIAYTWKQIATGKDVYDKTGYEQIESVAARLRAGAFA